MRESTKVDRPDAPRSAHTTEVKILPYRPTKCGQGDVCYVANKRILNSFNVVGDILLAKGDTPYSKMAAIVVFFCVLAN